MDDLTPGLTDDVNDDASCTSSLGSLWMMNDSRQSRGNQLDDLIRRLTDDVRDDALCTSSLGSLWIINDLPSERSTEVKKASKANRMQLDLKTKCKTSFDDKEGYVREEGPSFGESCSGQNQREEVLDGKMHHRRLVQLFLLHFVGVFYLSVWGFVVCIVVATLHSTHGDLLTLFFVDGIRKHSLHDHRVLHVCLSHLGWHLLTNGQISREMATKLIDPIFNHLPWRFSSCLLERGICTVHGFAHHFCAELSLLRVQLEKAPGK